MRRWERHWWENHDTQPMTAIRTEPTVWVDPSLVDESPKRRFGRLPSPSVIGAYCTLDGSDD
jgi:hypothetical protein